MSTAIDELAEKARKTLAMWESNVEKERQFLALLAGLKPGLPPDLPFTGATPYEVYGRAGLTLAVERFADVRAVFDRLPPVPAVKYEDSCLSFRPAEYRDKLYAATITPVFPFWVDFQYVTAPKAEAVWYSSVNGILVRVTCEVKQTQGLARWFEVFPLVVDGKRIVEYRFGHRLTGDRVRWYSSGRPRTTVFWPVSATNEQVFAISDKEKSA